MCFSSCILFQGLANCSLPLTVFINKILLKQSHAHSFKYYLWLISSSSIRVGYHRDFMAHGYMFVPLKISLLTLVLVILVPSLETNPPFLFSEIWCALTLYILYNSLPLHTHTSDDYIHKMSFFST